MHMGMQQMYERRKEWYVFGKCIELAYTHRRARAHRFGVLACRVKETRTLALPRVRRGVDVAVRGVRERADAGVASREEMGGGDGLVWMGGESRPQDRFSLQNRCSSTACQLAGPSLFEV